MANPVIMLEFNELTPALIDRYIREGLLPNFKRLRDESVAAVTDAEEAPPYLEPWIQWVTVHTGLRFAEHKVFDLDDGPDLEAPRIWDLVSDAGRNVWICGSMNAAVQKGHINGHVLPDPWASRVAPQPPGFFDPYVNLVRRYVQEYTSDRPGVTKTDYLNFGRFMLANGLSLKTVTRTMRQLASELTNPVSWKRAMILDRLQWDVFRKIYRNERPTLSTFFLNSTAHYQHYFWREMEPERFKSKSAPDVQARYGDAIRSGYQAMDEIIGECLDLAGTEATVILCTALSQQPMLTFEDTGGKQIYKPHDQAALFRFAGVEEDYDYNPVMAEQFHLDFGNEAAAIAAEAKIRALRLDDGTELMLARRDGNRIFSGCKLQIPPHADAKVLGAASNAALPFSQLFYPVEARRSGMHHPDGIFWVRLPGRRGMAVSRKVTLPEIAPTIMHLTGIETPHRFSAPALPEILSCARAEPDRAAA